MSNQTLFLEHLLHNGQKTQQDYLVIRQESHRTRLGLSFLPFFQSKEMCTTAIHFSCVNISRKANKLGLRFLPSQPTDHRKLSRKPHHLKKRKKYSTRKAEGVSNWLMQLFPSGTAYYFSIDTISIRLMLYVFNFIVRRSEYPPPSQLPKYPAHGSLSVTTEDLGLALLVTEKSLCQFHVDGGRRHKTPGSGRYYSWHSMQPLHTSVVPVLLPRG